MLVVHRLQKLKLRLLLLSRQALIANVFNQPGRIGLRRIDQRSLIDTRQE